MNDEYIDNLCIKFFEENKKSLFRKFTFLRERNSTKQKSEIRYIDKKLIFCFYTYDDRQITTNHYFTDIESKHLLDDIIQTLIAHGMLILNNDCLIYEQERYEKYLAYKELDKQILKKQINNKGVKL